MTRTRLHACAQARWRILLLLLLLLLLTLLLRLQLLLLLLRHGGLLSILLLLLPLLLLLLLVPFLPARVIDILVCVGRTFLAPFVLRAALFIACFMKRFVASSWC